MVRRGDFNSRVLNCRFNTFLKRGLVGGFLFWYLFLFWKGLFGGSLFLWWRDFCYRRREIPTSISPIKRFVIQKGMDCSVDRVSVV